MRNYYITVHTAEGCSCYIAIARTGLLAVSDALGQFPDARRVSAKPLRTHRAR